MSHYKWLEVNFPKLLSNLGLNKYVTYTQSIISADADKCYSYESIWENNGIPFEHGVALYLLTNLEPYNKEVRQTDNGWVAPYEWVINKYDELKEYLK